MLKTLSEEEKSPIRASIQSMVEERDEIQLLLAQLRNLLEDARRK